MSALYAVRTTGIVCRVGCASRAPRPENSERHLRRLVRQELGTSPRAAVPA